MPEFKPTHRLYRLHWSKAREGIVETQSGNQWFRTRDGSHYLFDDCAGDRLEPIEPTVGTAEWALRELEQGREVSRPGWAHEDCGWWHPSRKEDFKGINAIIYTDWLNREMWAAMNSGQSGSGDAATRKDAGRDRADSDVGSLPAESRESRIPTPQPDDRLCLVCRVECEGRLCIPHWSAWNAVATSLHKQDDFESWCRRERVALDVPRCLATKERVE